jgi:hypothetical protein
LGIVAALKKGPRGLFEVYVPDGVMYSNRSEGGRLPRNEEIIEKLRTHQECRQGSAATGAEAKPPGGAPGSGCG